MWVDLFTWLNQQTDLETKDLIGTLKELFLEFTASLPRQLDLEMAPDITLDVHVLTLPGLPSNWIEERQVSIARAIASAGYSIQLYEVPGIKGHLGKSRALGYNQGSSLYVTHVDHDDMVREDAFHLLHEHLLEQREAITTGELLLFEDGRVQEAKDSKHHLAVYRRDRLNQINYASFVHYPDQYILQHFHPFHIPECAYLHRIWKNSLSREQRRSNPEKAKEELDKVKNSELCRIELMTQAQIAKEIDKELSNA